MVARLISDAEKTRWVIALAAAWLLLGLLPHDPWKPDEAYTFGIVWRMVEHGQWWSAHVGDQPFTGAPALLFHWSAALFTKVFGALLPAHDAARLASAAWVALALWSIGLSARELYGKGHGRYAVLAFAGCIGLLERTHLLLVDTALLAALGFLFYGLARSRRAGGATWAVIGVAIAVAFLTKGLLGLTFASALVAAFIWAHRAQPRIGATLWRALVLSATIIGAWMAVVSAVAPASLAAWLKLLAESVADALSPLRIGKALLQTMGTLVWFAFPALPLAVWSAHLIRRGFIGGPKQFSYRFCVAAFGGMLLVYLFAPNARTTELMPLLIPLAVLSIPGLDHLKRGQSGFLDWLGIVFFGLVILLAWTFWSTLHLGAPRGMFSKMLNNFQPGFNASIQPLAVALALLLTVVWFAMIRPARRTHKRALVNWTVGITAVWGVAMLLHMRYLDFGKSYRAPVQGIAQALPAEVRAGAKCLSSVGLGVSQRAMLDYFADLQPRVADEKNPQLCDWVITQESTNNPVKWSPAPTQYVRVWTGMRPGGVDEPWHLYQRRN